MLTLATNAVPIIRRLTSRAADPDQAGLRIAGSDDPDTLSVDLSPAPAAGDIVLLHGGARVFLDPAVSPRLESAELYALAQDGDVRLALRPVPPTVG